MGPDPAVAAVRRAVRELLTALASPAPTSPAPSSPALNDPAPTAPEPIPDAATPPLINSSFWSPGQPKTAVDHGGRRVLVACSGGADSLALAAATAFVAPRLGIAAGLVTVDHGLQPGSSEQAERVAEIGYELGLDPVEIVPVDVARNDVGRAGGPEAAARDARYSALESVASALDASVLLGHTLDDQAETVLLGLGRGSGPRSIAGMRAVTGRWLRPFLGLRRATTVAACAALGLTPWDDPHNVDPAFRRVRLRREVLPLLEDVLAGGVAEALARTASMVQDDMDALDALASSLINSSFWSPGQPKSTVDHGRESEAELDGTGLDGKGLDGKGNLDVAGLAERPRAIRTRVLKAWAERAGAEPLTAVHVGALDALLTDWHGQGPVDLPGGIRAVRASGKLVVGTPSNDVNPPTPAPADQPPPAQEQQRA